MNFKTPLELFNYLKEKGEDHAIEAPLIEKDKKRGDFENNPELSENIKLVA